MRYFVTIDGKEHTVEVSLRPGGGYDVKLVENGDQPLKETAIDCNVLGSAGGLSLNIGGRVYDLVLDGEMPKLDVFSSGRRTAVGIESARMRATASMKRGGGPGNGLVTSPMPGKVVKVLVTEGEEVTAGKALIVVEAMKMENELTAEAAGTVKQVFVKPGDAVEGGAKLISIA